MYIHTYTYPVYDIHVRTNSTELQLNLAGDYRLIKEKYQCELKEVTTPTTPVSL